MILSRQRDEIVKAAQEESNSVVESVEKNETGEVSEDLAQEEKEQEVELVQEEEKEKEKVVQEEVVTPTKQEVKFEDEKVELKPVFMQAKVSLDELEKQIEE